MNQIEITHSIVSIVIAIVWFIAGISVGKYLELKRQKKSLMKYTYLLIIIFICGCGEPYPIKKEGYEFKVIVLDECEYFVSGVGNFTHKGNCKYCLRRYSVQKYGYLDSITLKGNAFAYWYGLDSLKTK